MCVKREAEKRLSHDMSYVVYRLPTYSEILPTTPLPPSLPRCLSSSSRNSAREYLQLFTFFFFPVVVLVSMLFGFFFFFWFGLTNAPLY